MRNTCFRLLTACLCCCLLFAFFAPPVISADAFPVRRPAPDQENDPNDPDAAQNISGTGLVTEMSGFYSVDFLFNGRKVTGLTSDGNVTLTLAHPDGIGWLYFIFLKEYGAYTVINNDTGDRVTCGTDNFLHEVVDLCTLFGSAVSSVTVEFSNGPVGLCELYAYTPGYLPAYVQQWELPKEGKTDLILFSTHGDDDQLFFAGLLPCYSALGYEVLVVYMTDHRNNVQNRIHEMLNGLWAVGLRTYPVFGSFDDFFCNDLETAYTIFEQHGTTKDDLVGFITEQLRRYKPQVVVGHDFNGEYRHGQHMAYADSLAAALEAGKDPAEFPESAERFGTWDVPKAYFHLYEENPIVMDWDTPMEALDGMTPFEVTQLRGYPQHESQCNSWVSQWINGAGFSISKASQILTYSPCQYGLYKTTVGADVLKNDFFENLTSYKEQERLAEEARLEAERLDAEEAARLEAEAAAKEAAEAARVAEEARLAEESRLAEAAALAEAARQESRRRITAAACAAGSLILAAVLILWMHKKHVFT